MGVVAHMALGPHPGDGRQIHICVHPSRRITGPAGQNAILGKAQIGRAKDGPLPHILIHRWTPSRCSNSC